MDRRISISKILFYTPYSIWLILSILQQTFYRDIIPVGSLFNFIRIILYIFLFMKILYENKYSLKSILAFLVFCLLFIVTLHSNGSLLIDTFLLIYSAKNLDIREVIKVTFFIEVFMIIFIVLSCWFGIIKNDVWYRNKIMPRYGLGYKYSTFLANYYFHVILMYLYIKNSRIFKLKEGFIILLLNYIIYRYTDTRAVYYLIIITVILAYALNYLKKPIKDLKLSKYFAEYCFPISAIVSIIATINYNPFNKFYNLLNQMLTGRLELGNRAYLDYGLNIWGQKITWIVGRVGIDRSSDTVYNFVDCAYLNIALVYGVLILILICLGFVYIGKKAVKTNDKYLCLILVFLALHSITDPQLIELRYNPFLFMFGMFFYKKYRFKNNKL